MGLITDLRAADKSGLFQSDDTYTMYPTGLLPLDYANGFWQQTKMKDGSVQMLPMTGLMGGTFTSVIGTTGAGKTTLCDQMAYSIIRPYADGLLIHIDAEKTSNKQRILQICGAKDDGRIQLTKSHTSIDEVLDMVKDVCDTKQRLGRQIMYKAPVPGVEGETFWQYPPTVFIIDSLPAFNAKSYNVDNLGGNTDGMSAARETTRFYTNCIDRAWQYNLSFIVINHIKPKVEMNAYAAPPKGLLLLGQAEHLPRGQVAQYYSQTYFRLNMRKSDAYTLEDNGFTGYKCTCQLAKSKTNSSGTSFPVALIGNYGFDQYYTIYEFANYCGLIKGRNPYLYFDGFEDMKFNRKDFRRKLMYEDMFREMVLTAIRPGLEALLSDKPAYSDSEPVQEFGSLILPSVMSALKVA